MEKQKRMGLIKHLEELRKRLIIVFLAFLAATIASLYFSSWILDYLLKFTQGFEFIYDSPSGLMAQYIKVSMLCGIVLTIPVTLYELLAFLYPALKPKEKRMVGVLLGIGLLFFIVGIGFAYKIMIPFMLDFFVSMNDNTQIHTTITLESYINFLGTMFITFGIIFEMPTVLAAFTHFGLMKSSWLLKGQKYAVLIIFIVAAVITPPDVVSQIMAAIPLLLLYELSLGICYLIERQKRRKATD